MGLTTDPDDPRLGHGVDKEPIEQHSVYLVLSEEERAKGFVRPYCDRYIHVGSAGPEFELRDLTPEERERHADRYVKFEPYPEESGKLGRYWTQEQLDNIGRGCGVETRMGVALSETYARSPGFYGATYCAGCRMHLTVGTHGEFVWSDGSGRMLTRDGKLWRVGT